MSKTGVEYLLSADKRRFDVMGSLMVAPVVMPLAAATGVVAGFDTRRQPLFMQKRRGGRGEQTFMAFKLRTLQPSSHEPLNEDAPKVTYGTFDPRASRIGKLIRMSGLDETPQLWNVLKGDMSLVGPRPLTQVAIERNQSAAPQLFDEWYDIFKTVKPGLTCEGQLYRHHFRETSRELIRQTIEMDLRYFETASLVGDTAWALSVPASILKANVGIMEQVEQPSGSESWLSERAIS